MPKAKTTPKARILLVEDDKANAPMTRESLEREDFEVELVKDAEEALEVISSMQPDLVLMDIRLPNMNGLEATKKIRQDENDALSEVPIIALTAHAMKHDEQKTLDAGCDAYHAKPIAFPQLFRQIDDLLN